MTQVSSLESSLKARELGCPQGISEKVYALFYDTNKWSLMLRKDINKDWVLKDVVDARSLDEWLEILPLELIDKKDTLQKIDVYPFTKDKGWFVGYGFINFGCHKNPAEAANLLYNWLAENGYLKKEAGK